VFRGSIDDRGASTKEAVDGGGLLELWDTAGSVIRKGGIGGVAVVRSSLNATLIALQGLGSSINDSPLRAVARLGAICSGLMTLGSKGCKPVSLKAFLMISGVKVSLKGASIACKNALLFMKPHESLALSSRIWAYLLLN